MSNKKSKFFKNSSKLSAVRRADPQLERELANYPHPLPSREYILQILGEQEGVPVSFDRLCELLDVASFERELFQRRLGAMARDGQLLQNRRNDWLIPDKANLIRGRIQGHADGFGFLVPEVEPGKRPDKANDIFLSPKEMEKVLHGDKAIVRVVGVDRRGRPEGKIVEVTEHTNTRVVGRVFEEHGVWFVVAENRRISQDILIAPPQRGDKRTLMPKVGQVVMVEILEQPSKQSQPIGRVVEVLGNYADPGMEIEIALRKHELPYEFSDEAQAQTAKLPDAVRKADWKGREDITKLPDAVRKADWKGREDITKLPLVTIDGETARDFDDAVYCERQGKGYRLIVAIADVSHYVTAGSALDHDAYDRGNSVYFPRRVIPMLPEKLSNGLCSLNPQVERLCMVCDMDISNTGAVKRYRFYPAVMFSHARLTYTEVAAALYEGDAAMRKKLAPQLPNLEALDALFRLLAEARGKRGAIDFDTSETRMVFDDNGKIARIEPYERNDAHRLIEECMLAANVCASEFLHEHEHPVLYRIHEGPTPEKLAKLRDFLGTFGLQLGGGEEPHAKDYAKLMEKIEGRPDKALLQTVMLRSLRQAVYSPDNVGHFGLAYESYTHFTSPIRRYPDLLVHRAIKAVLAKKPYKPGDWADIGLHCSMTERRADDATRDVEAWLKCFYMQDRVGEEFTGSISSVVPFGIFVALDDVFIEGLVHVSELGRDYFHFDEAQHAMMGERTGVRYRLSDRVRVQLVRVDMETNKIDFRLVEGVVEAPAIHKPNLPVVTVAPVKPAKVEKAEKPKAAKPKKGAKKASPPIVESALPMVSPKAQLQAAPAKAKAPAASATEPVASFGKKSAKKPRAALLGGQLIPLPEVSAAPSKAKKAVAKAATGKAVGKASAKPKAKTVAKKATAKTAAAPKKAATKTAAKASPKKAVTKKAVDKQPAAPKKSAPAKKAAAPAAKKAAPKTTAKKASSGKSTARKG